MNKKLKTKWLKALRSGKYRQGRGRLGSRDGALCCIGVGACVLDPKFDAFNGVTGWAASSLGLTDDQKNTLVRLNDEEFKSFKQIALYIERHL